MKRFLIPICFLFIFTKLFGQNSFKLGVYVGPEYISLTTKRIDPFKVNNDIRFSFALKAKLEYFKESKSIAFLDLSYHHIDELKRSVTGIRFPNDTKSLTLSSYSSTYNFSHFSIGIGKTFDLLNWMNLGARISIIKHFETGYQRDFYHGWSATHNYESFNHRRTNFSLGLATNISIYKAVTLDLTYDFFYFPYQIDFGSYMTSYISRFGLFLGYEF